MHNPSRPSSRIFIFFELVIQFYTWYQRKQWQPTPVLLPGKSHGRRSLIGWVTSLSLFTFMLWRKKWQPTAVFLSGESQGQRSLVGCRLWGSHRVGHDWSDLVAAAAAAYVIYYSLFIKEASSARLSPSSCVILYN